MNKVEQPTFLGGTSYEKATKIENGNVNLDNIVSGNEKCSECNGIGLVWKTITINGKEQSISGECPKCNNSHKIPIEPPTFHSRSDVDSFIKGWESANKDGSKTVIQGLLQNAKRDNQGKLQWSQIEFSLMEDMVRALEHGAAKYDRNNWRKGHPITDIADSVLRHLFAFMSGEDNDQESGVSHLGHIQANIMFMMNVLKNKPELDNRYKHGS